MKRNHLLKSTTSPAERLKYFDQFDFTDTSLLDALRQFLFKFPLVGETQEQDRMLSAFSQYYFECQTSPSTQKAYLNSDYIHKLVYAIVLLNTDLHHLSMKVWRWWSFIHM